MSEQTEYSMGNKGKTFLARIEGYGVEGDMIASPLNFSKKAVIKDYSDNIDQTVFSGDIVQIKIKGESKKTMFAEMTAVVDKKVERKYRFLMDIADLLHLGKDNFNFYERKGVDLPMSFTKEGLRESLLKLRHLYRKTGELEKRIEYLEDKLDSEKYSTWG